MKAYPLGAMRAFAGWNERAVLDAEKQPALHDDDIVFLHQT